jgi:hypothetical protein
MEEVRDWERLFVGEIKALHKVLAILRAAIRWGQAQTPPLIDKSPFHRFGVRLNTKAETVRDRRISREEPRALAFRSGDGLAQRVLIHQSVRYYGDAGLRQTRPFRTSRQALKPSRRSSGTHKPNSAPADRDTFDGDRSPLKRRCSAG